METKNDEQKNEIENKKEKNNKKKNYKKKNIFLTILKWLIIILLILVIIAVITGYMYINNMLGKTKKEDLDESQIGLNDQTEQQLKNYRNIALFGIDSRADNYEPGNRSDTIMVASINQDTKEVKIFSVYRDTYLSVKSNGNNILTKVGHAYAFGGAQNAVLALNTNLDLNIKEYVTVNFNAVEAAVDALDGIEINIDPTEIQYLNFYIDENAKIFGRTAEHINTPGKYNLNGIQAVAYVRIRYTEGGDYKRTERQRVVLNAMIDKAKAMDVTRLQNVANSVLPMISTNLSNTDIIGLIPQLINLKISSNTGWPYTTKGITLDAWYGVPMTLESNVVKLHKEIYGDTDYVTPESIKQISSKIESKTGYHEVDDKKKSESNY